jgi:hypothetical protein
MAGKNHESRKLLDDRDRRIEERICICLGLPRMTASGDAPNQGRRPIPIASLVAVAEASKRYLLDDLGGEVPPYAQIIEEMIKSVVSGDEQHAAARRAVVTEFNRWSKELTDSVTVVDFLRTVTGRALMPTIWSQSKAYFNRERISSSRSAHSASAACQSSSP